MQRFSRFAVLFALFGVLSGFLAPQSNSLKFEKTTHNFGNVKHNEPATIEFQFTNTSDKPVIIEDATAECGCTKPVFPPRPISPGKTGSIKVTYDSKTLGAFTKKITVKLINNPGLIELSISGNVVS